MYEKPICDCGNELVFVEANRINKNGKHNVYKIILNGKLGKIVEEYDMKLQPPFTKCKSCGAEWNVYYDEKGRIK
ncbi:hypothetical protein [Paenibacillus dendritiformis]|uniref:hypothetical protein n=1 Tax=Paenibacillus dendritiformis TaxID=130049 RepID=UPI00387E171D